MRNEQSNFTVFVCVPKHEERPKERMEWNTHTHTHSKSSEEKKTRTSSDYNKTGNLYSLLCVQERFVCHWFRYVRMLFMFVHSSMCVRAWVCVWVEYIVLLTLMLICASHNLSCQLSPILTLMVHVVYMDIFKMIFVGSFFSTLLVRAQDQVFISTYNTYGTYRCMLVGWLVSNQ